jgi:tetratricopeptide (TPR) repeat protein
MQIKIYLLKNDLSKAEQLLQEYTSNFPTSSLVNNSIFRLQLEILLLIGQGKYIDAQDSANRLLGIAKGTGKKAELWATQALSAYCYANLGNIEQALTLSTIAYKNLEQYEFNGNTSFLIQLYHFLVLKGANRLEDAYTMLEASYNRLITNANQLEDEEWRAAFLANIPEHQVLCHEWEQFQRKLEEGTVEITAAADHAAKRGQLKLFNHVKIHMTLCHPADEAEENSKTLRLKRITRLSKEAEAQHAVLSADTLANLLEVSRITIIRDLQELEASGLSIKTRGHLG